MRVAPGESVRFRVAAAAAENCYVTVAQDTNAGRFDPATGEFVFTAAGNARPGSFVVPFRAGLCSGVAGRAAVRIDIVSGAADGVGVAEVPVSAIGFAAAVPGSANGYVIVPVANSGNGPLAIGRIALANGTSFRIDGTLGLPVVLQPGQRLPVRLEFQPDRVGDLTDMLLIETSDRSAFVKLTGKGLD